ncbi:hypothetical protein E2562_001012 [Oryza meyeriana var. granulata]|uniref:NAC domain-containing protein n=1 Tax=Oryza meyeriana var. granulata TaxID=110450 RepID=A0A6G1EF83_9ORYZ|nr:hypothetical protein E2562_001012 [Oryza meyeriana var. granulata]
MASLDLLLKLGFRFNPSPEDVVTYYLPRLVAGKQPKDTEACIHRTDVYGAKAEPGDLAGRFAPVARSSSGDRFFFTECRRVKGRVSRAAGGGTWVSQSSKDIKNREGIKVGEIKNFRFKKDGKHKDWLMEEYHGCMQEAGDVEPVVCRIYVSPRAAQDSAALPDFGVEEEIKPQHRATGAVTHTQDGGAEGLPKAEDARSPGCRMKMAVHEMLIQLQETEKNINML